MGDPDFRSNEKILLRADGINVKSVPFEATLTDRRIVLVDRARNVLPQKDIPLFTIRQIATGENAIRDPTLTVYVAANNNESRQMVLTFSRNAGGNRTKERDEWKKFLEYYIPRAPPGPVSPAPEPAVSYRNEGVTPPKKRMVETVPSRDPARDIPTPAPAVPESFFCNRCGNRVTTDSAFCNKCGSPIVPPAPSPYTAPAPANAYSSSPLRTPVSATPVPAEAPVLDSIRISPEDLPVRPPVRAHSDTRNQNIPAPRKSAEPEPSKKPKKQGFIPSLFSSKSRSASKRSDSLAPAEPAPEKPRRRGGSGTGKKVILSAVVLVIIIAVIAVGVVFVYPMVSSGGLLTLPSGESSSAGSSSPGSATPSTTTPQGQTTPSVVTSWTPVAVETTAAVIPSAGVQVHISYLGGFKGSYGLPSALQSIQSSGERVFLVENATGTVQAIIEKRDGSTRHELLVEIYKDGKLLTKGTTNAAFGKVTLEVDTKTGVAKTPITSASVGTAATTAAAAVQKTTTTIAKTTTKAS